MNHSDRLRARLARRKAEDAAKLAKAKAEAQKRGKEPFDADALLKLFQPWSQVHVGARESWIASTEYQYYISFSELMTLKELAAKLAEIEMYDGGDMYIDKRIPPGPSKPPEEPAIQTLAKKMAAHALKRLQDPATGADIEAREELRGRHQELVIEGSRGLRKASAKAMDIAHIEELASYLATRDVERVDDRIVFSQGGRRLTITWQAAHVTIELDGDVRRVDLIASALLSTSLEEAIEQMIDGPQTG